MNTLFKELPLPAGIPQPPEGFVYVGVPKDCNPMPAGCIVLDDDQGNEWNRDDLTQWYQHPDFHFAAPLHMVERLPSSNPIPVASKAEQDKLSHLFDMQATLNARCGVVTDGLSDEDKVKWVLNYTRAMQQEIAELIDSVNWKWWAKYQKFDEQNAKVEVVDLFHFLISIAQVLGMSADDVHAAYVAKNKVNHARQDSGYVVKDEGDSKHI